MNATKVIELKKAAFITEYMKICKKFDMAVVMAPSDFDYNYPAFNVMLLNENEQFTDRMKYELLIETPSTFVTDDRQK